MSSSRLTPLNQIPSIFDKLNRIIDDSKTDKATKELLKEYTILLREAFNYSGEAMESLDSGVSFANRITTRQRR